MLPANISLADYLVAHFFRVFILFDVLRALIKYRDRFKNYLHVVYQYKRSKYPISALLRDDRLVILKNKGEVSAVVNGLNYDNSDDAIIVEGMHYKFRIKGAIDNGELFGIFYEDHYSFLPVKNKFVIDIGANIGDSSIYFASKGAQKVIALEPYPKNYKIAKGNIDANQLFSRIDLVLAGCSSRSDTIKVDRYRQGVLLPLEQDRKIEGNTDNVRLITLEEIIERYHINSAILKMDCEGCEYDCILLSSGSVLRRFTHIQVEYHYGYRKLKDKLELCGFNVKTTRPVYRYNQQATNPAMYVGWIYAELGSS